MELSEEQQRIINAPLVPLAVIACAGSGKTATAVRRLVRMRQLLAQDRGRIALLSFSNVAVETFRQNYLQLSQKVMDQTNAARVEIDTLDSFITRHVLRPHAHRTMRCSKTPFLVNGTEPFMAGLTCRRDSFPLPVAQVKVGIEGQLFYFYCDNLGQKERLHNAVVQPVLDNLGRSGGYTHEQGRYWCYRTLREQPAILRALAKRYPHILIDESQDIGDLHQAILELLSEAGVQVSLIGDPNQGIYAFAGANGDFLRNYHERPGVRRLLQLTCNYRSVPELVAVANHLTGRADTSNPRILQGVPGPFFIGYQERNLPHLIDSFHHDINQLQLNAKNAAILCRSRDLVDQLSGRNRTAGQGAVKFFARAALLRDRHQRYAEAYKAVAGGIIQLLTNAPQDLLSKLCHPGQDPALRELRKTLWVFTRDSDTGLPSSALPAQQEWLPLLLSRVRALLIHFQREYGLLSVENPGRKLTRAALPVHALNTEGDIAEQWLRHIRVDTVHQAKGESIDAVMYITRQPGQVRAMLNGIDTELGRIGYVALTRARYLFWLAVPADALQRLRPELLRAGFREATIAQD